MKLPLSADEIGFETSVDSSLLIVFTLEVCVAFTLAFLHLRTFVCKSETQPKCYGVFFCC